MRTALCNEQIAYLFDVCLQTIANYMSLARKDLLMNPVPEFINNNDRSVLLTHNTPIAKVLFDIPDDKLYYIFDTTYRFAQKSTNFAGQKQLWSKQKKMPLVKPMVGCTPDGYIAFVLGPFDANHNDATILGDCFSRYPEILKTIVVIIHSSNYVLVDRCFELFKRRKVFECFFVLDWVNLTP